jgi:hypothetical protein
LERGQEVVIFGLVYVVGVLASIFVYMNRAGMDWFHGAPLSQIFSSPEWFVVMMGKAMTWPAVLLLWTVLGRPPSPWGVSKTSRLGRVVRLPLSQRGQE